MPATANIFTPYSTIAPYLGAPPGYVRAEDAQRILSYQVYEEIYWNVDTAYKVVGRSDDITPIYVPNGRTIVDTTNRYVATGFGFTVTPGTDPQIYGTPEAQAIAKATMEAWFKREKFKSQFAMNKRFGLIRGDWLWHIVADPAKEPGKRISIYAVDPASWFPVYSDENLDKIVKHYLIDMFKNEKGEDRIKRLTYSYVDWVNGNYAITMSEEVYELDGWWKIDAKPESIVTPLTLLPAEITAFPIYHIKNFEEPANPYGSSELRGLERIIQAVSQAVSDEDLALALEGLGLYATDGGGPVNEDGEDEDWNLGPGQVIENAIGFRRVAGIGSLAPYDSHLDRLLQFLKEAAATPDIAIGKVDVTVAESGVALALNLSPMLAKAAEKDQEIMDVHTQMFYDLKTWFKVFEQIDFLLVELVPTFGDKVPVNVDKEIARAILMIDAGLWSVQTAREQLALKGIVFAADEDLRVSTQQAAAAATAQDTIDQRMSTELTTQGGASTGTGAAGGG